MFRFKFPGKTRSVYILKSMLNSSSVQTCLIWIFLFDFFVKKHLNIQEFPFPVDGNLQKKQGRRSGM